MTVIASDIIAADQFPSAGELWALMVMPRPSGDEGQVVTTRWSTDLLSARTQSEQRFSRLAKPYLSVETTFKAMFDDTIGVLLNQSHRFTTTNFVFPLWNDKLPAKRVDANTLALTLNLHLTRRLQIGQWVALVKWEKGKERAESFEFARVSAITQVGQQTHVGLDIATVLTSVVHEEGDIIVRSDLLIVPMIECDPLSDTDLQLITQSVSEVTLTVHQSVGPQALDPLTAFSVFPGFTLLDGSPILDLQSDFTQEGVGVTRPIQTIDIGLTSVYNIRGTRSKVRTSTSFTFFNRSDGLKLRQLFDGAAGRTLPFWILSPTNDFIPVSMSGTQITLEAGSQFIDLIDEDFTRYTKIAVQTTSGTFFYDITSKVGNVITVVGSLPGFNTVIRTCFAYLVRFEEDVLEEVWSTDEHWHTDVSFVEVLEEKSVSIPIADIALGGIFGAFSICGDNSNFLHPAGAVVFMIDNTASIGASGLLEQKALLADLVERLRIPGQPFLKEVGVVAVFGGAVVTALTLDADKVAADIAAVGLGSGTTDYDIAYSAANNMLWTAFPFAITFGEAHIIGMGDGFGTLPSTATKASIAGRQIMGHFIGLSFGSETFQATPSAWATAVSDMNGAMLTFNSGDLAVGEIDVSADSVVNTMLPTIYTSLS